MLTDYILSGFGVTFGAIIGFFGAVIGFFLAIQIAIILLAAVMAPIKFILNMIMKRIIAKKLKKMNDQPEEADHE